MTPLTFAKKLFALLDQPWSRADELLYNHGSVAVMVNPAAEGRPSAALIEYEGSLTVRLSVMINHLQANYAQRTVVIAEGGGRTVVLRAGDHSEQKRQVSRLIEAFLASLGVTRDKSMAVPFWAMVTASKTSLHGG